MTQQFIPGDNLVFQLESGYGLLRVLAVDDGPDGIVWHLRAYEELFPDVDSAEAAFLHVENLRSSIKHMALTDRAFERTPAAKLGHAPLSDEESKTYEEWSQDDARQIYDRSALQMLGLR